MGALAAVGPVDAVLLFPMLNIAELEELRREEVVMPPVDMAEDDVVLPLGNGALLLDDASAEDEMVTSVDEITEEDREELGDPVPVGPADVAVPLPMVKSAELEEVGIEEVGTEEVVFSSETVEEVLGLLEDPVPVGPADETVLLPMVKTAELEELRLEEVALLSEALELVMVLLLDLSLIQI